MQPITKMTAFSAARVKANTTTAARNAQVAKTPVTAKPKPPTRKATGVPMHKLDGFDPGSLGSVLRERLKQGR